MALVMDLVNRKYGHAVAISAIPPLLFKMPAIDLLSKIQIVV